MHLKILLPYALLIEAHKVLRLILETRQGSFGLLPQRLDCVAAIVPGILIYQCENAHENYVAVNSGVLTKAGNNVTISVREAFIGTDLNHLRNVVNQEFMQQSAVEKQVHTVMQKMESEFTRRLVEFHRDI